MAWANPQGLLWGGFGRICGSGRLSLHGNKAGGVRPLLGKVLVLVGFLTTFPKRFSLPAHFKDMI